MPAHWEPIDPSHNNRVLVPLLDHIPKHVAEKNVIIKQAALTYKGEIQAIYRIQNLHLHRAYERRKQELQRAGVIFEERLNMFHGSRHNKPSLIYESQTGFEPNFGAG